MKRWRSAATRQALWLAGLAACNDLGSGPTGHGDVALELSGLGVLDPEREGTYEVWAVTTDGSIGSLGRFEASATPFSVTFSAPRATLTDVMISVEPPGDDDDRPSLHRLLGGSFDGGIAALGTTGYLTVPGVPLEPSPGSHVLASPSNDDHSGFPSREDAGLWLYNPTVDTLDAAHYVDLAPLTEGWWYEGWVVRDYGSTNAVWLSYGKFRSDGFRQANSRDDTGLGLFSGRRDYKFALILQLHVPGDDWLSDTLGLATVPGGVQLPIDLNGDAASNTASRWTHVITIEPWGPLREAELPDASDPFFIVPYRNAIGVAPPSHPRVIEYVGEGLASGTARIVNR